jgi:hypothetical protein
MLEDFSAKVGREDIVKPAAGNGNEIYNDNGVRLAKLPHLKISVKSAMFPHHSSHT